MDLDLCFSLGESKSVSDFRNRLVKVAYDLGYDKFSAMIVLPRQDAGALKVDAQKLPGTTLTKADHQVFINIANLPDSYTAEYLDLPSGKRCPVMQHTKSCSLPIVWDRTDYQKAGSEELWEAQAAHGYCAGIATALHLAGGRHFMISFDRDKSNPKHREEMQRQVNDLQLISVYAQDAAFKLFLKPHGDPGLSLREMEVLRWTAEGKTAGEIATIIGVSPSTAAKYNQSILQKLDCSSQNMAITKAHRLGIIA